MFIHRLPELKSLIVSLFNSFKSILKKGSCIFCTDCCPLICLPHNILHARKKWRNGLSHARVTFSQSEKILFPERLEIKFSLLLVRGVNRQCPGKENDEVFVRSLAWVWINWMTKLTGGSYFKMRIVLGAIIIWFLVFDICVPECVRICELKSRSSNLDRAPKMQDSVLLNSRDGFVVTLPSISSKTCVIFPR